MGLRLGLGFRVTVKVEVRVEVGVGVMGLQLGLGLGVYTDLHLERLHIPSSYKLFCFTCVYRYCCQNIGSPKYYNTENGQQCWSPFLCLKNLPRKSVFDYHFHLNAHKILHYPLSMSPSSHMVYAVVAC